MLLAASRRRHLSLSHKFARNSQREELHNRETLGTTGIDFREIHAGWPTVSNDQRLSEQLERMVPGLEVINISLEGSGTDQQLLLYEDIGQRYEHDLVLLMPFLSNLRRNMVAARDAIDPHTEQVVLRKPRFELIDGELVRRIVCLSPVSFQPRAMGQSKPTVIDLAYRGLKQYSAICLALPG